jgi:hypothetical protein
MVRVLTGQGVVGHILASRKGIARERKNTQESALIRALGETGERSADIQEDG